MSEDFDKYLGIANHDIQRANNIGELKSYVASILYDNDKKAELLQQKENIIKEVREYIKDKYYDRFLKDGLEEWLNDNGLNDRKQIMCILEMLGSDKE